MGKYVIQPRERVLDKSSVVYPVEKLPLNFKDVELATEQAQKGVYDGDLGCAIVRNDKNQIISTVSSDYQLVPHEDIINAVEGIFEANKWDYSLWDVRTGGRRGNKMYLRYHLPHYSFDVKEGDSLVPYIQIYNSYDKSLLFGASAGLFRLTCSNGAMIRAKSQSLHARHYLNNINVIDIAFSIEAMMEEVGMAKAKLQIMVKEAISDVTIEELLPKIFKRERDVKKIKELGLLEDYFTEMGKNKYAFFNACTAYATHELPKHSGNYDHEFEVQNKISKIFFSN